MVETPGIVWDVLSEVEDEMAAQETKWGEQNHPDGTGDDGYVHACATAKLTCQIAAAAGGLTWVDILTEEVMEAFAETDPERIREELIQVAAVAVTWAEAIDRRGDGED